MLNDRMKQPHKCNSTFCLIFVLPWNIVKSSYTVQMSRSDEIYSTIFRLEDFKCTKLWGFTAAVMCRCYFYVDKKFDFAKLLYNLVAVGWPFICSHILNFLYLAEKANFIAQKENLFSFFIFFTLFLLKQEDGFRKSEQGGEEWMRVALSELTCGSVLRDVLAKPAMLL